MYFFFARFLAIDTPDFVCSANELQRISMIRFFVSLENTYQSKKDEHLQKIVSKKDGAVLEDECSWIGVGCVENIVDSINLRSHRECIRMEWLPSSIRYIALHRCNTSTGWTADELPRALRFLSMSQCRNMSDYRKKQKCSKKVDLQRLPSSLEELFVVDGWFVGDLRITDLPKTLRLLLISNDYIRKAHIAFENLPPKLLMLCVKSYRKVTIKAIGDKLEDSRVTSDASSWDVLKFSSYWGRFSA